MAPKAYDSTKVPVSKSQEELRQLLRKFGAEQFTMGEGDDWAGVEFVHSDTVVRLRCPIRPFDEEAARAEATEKRVAYATIAARYGDHEAARVWRVLVWSVKARLVAVEEGLETFEQAFFSHLVDPVTRRTIWERVRDEVAAGALKITGPGLKALGAGS